MKYKFAVNTALLDEELQTVLAATAEGLQGTSHLIVTANISVNTELPDDKIETLRQGISEALSSKFGSVEAELFSQEN